MTFKANIVPPPFCSLVEMKKGDRSDFPVDGNNRQKSGFSLP